MATKYPKLILTVTDGSSTKNVELTSVKPKASLTNAAVKTLGEAFAEAFGASYNYTGGQYVESAPIGTPD